MCSAETEAVGNGFVIVSIILELDACFYVVKTKQKNLQVRES